MRKGIIFALLFTAPVMVQAGVYTCEINGRKVYQSRPCASGDKPTQIKPVNAISAPKTNPNSILEKVEQQTDSRSQAQDTLNERSEQARLQREKKEAIRRGKVLVGMDTADVLAALGQPDSRTSSMESGHAMERWIYGGRIGMERMRVYFRNGRVISTTEQ